MAALPSAAITLTRPNAAMPGLERARVGSA